MKVVVRDSPVHGRGVFAARRIEAAEVVVERCRTRLTDDEVLRLQHLVLSFERLS
jgi:hypothetical protein